MSGKQSVGSDFAKRSSRFAAVIVQYGLAAITTNRAPAALPSPAPVFRNCAAATRMIRQPPDRPSLAAGGKQQVSSLDGTFLPPVRIHFCAGDQQATTA